MSVLYSRHFLLKSFSLRLIKKVHVDYHPFHEKEITKGVWDFYDKCLSNKFRKTNPNCEVKLTLNEVGKPPEVIIEFEDGRKLHYDDASYLTAVNIMEQIRLKKRKIKHFYRTSGKEFYDSDDEDEWTRKIAAQEAASAAAASKGKGKK